MVKMSDGGYYLEINEQICCRVNLSVRNWRGAYRTSPAFGGHGDAELVSSQDYMSPTYRALDASGVPLGSAIFYGANVTWQDVRQITSNFTPDVTAFCDVKGENKSYNLSEVNYSLVSQADYMGRVLGERYVSTEKLVVLTFLYVLIFLTGVLGNVCTCVVITRNRFLHTATNYYLFSLAISDVITLLLGK